MHIGTWAKSGAHPSNFRYVNCYIWGSLPLSLSIQSRYMTCRPRVTRSLCSRHPKIRTGQRSMFALNLPFRSQTLIAKFPSPGWNETFQEEYFNGVKSAQLKRSWISHRQPHLDPSAASAIQTWHFKDFISYLWFWCISTPGLRRYFSHVGLYRKHPWKHEQRWRHELSVWVRFQATNKTFSREPTSDKLKRAWNRHPSRPSRPSPNFIQFT